MYVYVYRHSVLESILHVIKKKKKKNSTITSFLLKKLQKRAGLSGVCTTSLFSPNPLYSSCLFPSASLLQNSPISLCSLQAALENKGHQKDYHNSERKAQMTHKSAGELSGALCKCKPKTQHRMGCYEDSQLHPSQTQHSKTVETNNNDL